MKTILLAANTLLALAGVAAALLALLRPQVMSRSPQVDKGEKFYARMYVSRAIPAGIAAAIAPFCFDGGAVPLVLYAAAAMQIGDAIIGWSRKEWGMLIAPAFAAIVHGATAWQLSS